MHAKLIELEKKLWSAADELRANSELKASGYSVPVLGLIFLRYADLKFAKTKNPPRFILIRSPWIPFDISVHFL